MDQPKLTLENLKILPALKPALIISDGGFDYWQEKVWILTDKITNKLYYLGRLQYEVISRWESIPLIELVENVNRDTLLDIKPEDVEQILRFLLMSNLLQVSSEVMGKVSAANQKNWQSIVQYAGKLFSWRIALCNPDKFLIKTQEWVKPLFSRGFFYFIVVLFIVNLYLLASNWGSFTDSIPSFTTFTSVILVIFTMFLTKIVHELGHAYACRLEGCKVPEMGVIFIFFYPLLYTDVSSSIVLKPQERLIISTAGIRFEIYLAVIAGTLWFGVPEDSMIKHLLFFVAAVSWLVSLAINVVPFMRFDGYYILSDYLHIRNLGIRSSAIFKYYTRKKIFGMESVLPESYNNKKYRFFFIFAILSGVYKAALFVTILLFLYYTEILGFPLFLLGLFLFVLMPIGKELYTVWQLRGSLKDKTNINITSAILLIFLVLMFIPVRDNIYMPAVLFSNTQRIYTPFAAKIENITVKLNDDVQPNTRLLTLANSKLTTDTFVNQVNLDTEKHYSAGVMLSDETRQHRLKEQSNTQYQETLKSNLELINKRLEVLSPFGGKVTAIKDEIYNGVWLGKNSWLLDIVDYNTNYLQAFITAEDMRILDLEKKHKAVFIPNRYELPTYNVTLKAISNEPINEIPMEPVVPLSLARSTVVNSNLLYFASEYGGNINLAVDEKHNWVPVESFFTLEFSPNIEPKFKNLQFVKGIVKIQGKNQSLASRLYHHVKRLFLKNT